LGDVQGARGNLDAALQVYRESLAIREKLAAQDRSNSEWQRDLSVSFERIGDVQSVRGDLNGALKAYQDGLAIREKLAAQDPTNAGWQRDLIVSHWKLAEVAEQQEVQLPKAERHYRTALEVTLALRDGGRLAPADGWMIGDLQTRLERVSTHAAR
jgi:tetratricopeptide (TPR) repeat protein